MWSLIAEAKFSDGTVLNDLGTSLSAGSFIEPMRELGLTLDSLKRVEGIFASVAKGLVSDKKASRSTLPVCVRLFCQRESMNGAPHLEDHMKGGWGFYVIERGRNDPNVFFQEYTRIIELYLYREGPV